MTPKDSGEKVVGLFGRHFVSLMVTFRTPSGEVRSDTCSGFVLSVQGLWFLVTAGHVVREIRGLTQQGCEYLGAALVDSLGHHAKHSEPIPFDFRNSLFSIQEDDDTGADVCVAALEVPYVRQLVANGIEPLGEGVWRNPPPDFDLAAVLGVPEESIKQVGTPQRPGEIDTTTLLIPLTPCAEPEEMKKTGARFYAKVPDQMIRSDGTELMSVRGMSGGPIFAIKNLPDGSQRYWLLAVQTAWKKSLRTVAGNYAKPLAEAIERAVAQVIAEQEPRHRGINV